MARKRQERKPDQPGPEPMCPYCGWYSDSDRYHNTGPIVCSNCNRFFYRYVEHKQSYECYRIAKCLKCAALVGVYPHGGMLAHQSREQDGVCPEYQAYEEIYDDDRTT